MALSFPIVSVVIIARDEAADIGTTVAAAVDQIVPGSTVEVIVIDDGSTDGTSAYAARAGAAVVSSAEPGQAGNPARARNVGARCSRGNPIVFLDADCRPATGWLQALLLAHGRGATVVGGAIDMAPGISAIARCDYYCGCYLTHSGAPEGWVPHHPPNNISVLRDAFLSTSGFTERAPLNYTNEERHWQQELRQRGEKIYFEPAARVFHKNRPGLRSFMLRSYRWAYSAIEAKGQTQSARHAWMYRSAPALIVLSLPYAAVQTIYISWCWLKRGQFEPLLFLPLIALSRLAYAVGLSVGGIDYLRRRRRLDAVSHKQWPKERTD
jgi:glycosyltransferase involved in cell wall biosynthesis